MNKVNTRTIITVIIYIKKSTCANYFYVRNTLIITFNVVLFKVTDGCIEYLQFLIIFLSHCSYITIRIVNYYDSYV